MTRQMLCASILAIAAAVGASGSTVYSNTTTDTFDTIFYSVGPFSGLGDEVSLAGADRLATQATVQFFNNGAAGTFDAVLRLFQVGAPVGAQIGTDFSVNVIAAPSLGVFNVAFDTGGILVPDNLIFLVYLGNVSNGVDVGLNMFEPPSIGASDGSFMIRDAGGFSALSTPNENVFFQLDATTQGPPIPEPATLAMVGGGLLLALLANRRK